jgi:hypothetical protein
MAMNRILMCRVDPPVSHNNLRPAKYQLFDEICPKMCVGGRGGGVRMIFGVELKDEKNISMPPLKKRKCNICGSSKPLQ